MVVPNQAHSLPALADGTVTTYAGTGTTIEVLQGTTRLSFAAGGTAPGTFVITGSVVVPGGAITPGALSGYGTFVATVANHSGASAGQDVISVGWLITAYPTGGGAISLSAVQTLTKAKTGAGGAAAQSMVLDVSSLVVTFDTDSTPMPNPQTVSITAMLQNISGTAAFTAARYDASNNPLSGVTLGGSGNTRTLTAAQFGNAQYCIITVTLGALTAQTTVQRLLSGPPLARAGTPGFFEVYSEATPNVVSQVQFRRDGTVWIRSGSAAWAQLPNWFIGGSGTVGDDYDVRYQVMTSTGSVTGAINAWFRMTSDRTISCSAGTSYGTTFSKTNFQYYVRRASDGVTVVSGAGYMEALQA